MYVTFFFFYCIYYFFNILRVLSIAHTHNTKTKPQSMFSFYKNPIHTNYHTLFLYYNSYLNMFLLTYINVHNIFGSSNLILIDTFFVKLTLRHSNM